MIILVRADDRLIHGMVAVSWTSAIKPETILVANDAAAGDSFKAATMKLAKPAGAEQSDQRTEKNIPGHGNRRRCLLHLGTRQGDRQAQHRHSRRQQEAGRRLHSDAAASLHDAEGI